jgi:acyl-CoA reductase-like NAD-dependent aldehyde dehydrogenase
MWYGNDMRTVDTVFIAGAFKPAGGAEHTLVAPATESVHCSVRDADLADVDEAVSAARRAASAWAQMIPEKRGAFVASIGLILAERSEELARSFAIEIGTPLADARSLQVALALRVFAQAPALASAAAAEELIGSTRVRRVPIGVAACITPWNYPLYQIATKIVPALVAGATVVLKPSEIAPLSVQALAVAAQRTGLPPGVLNIVFGGAEIGRHLVTHPGIDVVSFTGSTMTGRQVAALAGDGLKKVSLELGGKSAGIALPDADLAQAVHQTLAKCYQNAGQTCAALTRLLVPRKQLGAAIGLAASEALIYRVGDPFESSTRLGPVASAGQWDKVTTLIQRGVAAGAELVCGGAERPREFQRGYYVAPTVMVTEQPTLEIAQTEIFGPVLTIIPYEDEIEAISIANGTPYSLAAAVWASDPGRAEGIASQLRAGSVSINGARTNPDAPFGGFGASGFGRERGRYGLDTYSTTQALHE